MARMKFLCDTKRCIECNGCVTACKNENDDALEWGHPASPRSHAQRW